MSVALLVITDGREEYLGQAVTSAAHRLHGPIAERWMYDDTGDERYRAALRARYPEWRHIDAGPRQGFGGAIAAAWAHLDAHTQARWVFHLEQDFVINRDVDLAAMGEVLTECPHVAQMALRRQAWNPAEVAAGGVVQMHPLSYEDCMDMLGRCWLEHTLFWTTNPSLYRRSLLPAGWPKVPRSEGEYTARLLRHGTPEMDAAGVRFGYWGLREDAPWVTHIGHHRAGNGY